VDVSLDFRVVAICSVALAVVLIDRELVDVDALNASEVDDDLRSPLGHVATERVHAAGRAEEVVHRLLSELVLSLRVASREQDELALGDRDHHPSHARADRAVAHAGALYVRAHLEPNFSAMA